MFIGAAFCACLKKKKPTTEKQKKPKTVSTQFKIKPIFNFYKITIQREFSTTQMRHKHLWQ
jgi:hypothetical protein